MKRRLLWIIVGLLIGILTAGGTAYAVVRAETPGGAFDNSLQDSLNAVQNRDTARLAKDQPAPSLSYSVERQNLIQRYKTFSDRNKISYIALTTINGAVVYTGAVKGKVSNLSSELTPADRMQCTQNGGGDSASSSCVPILMPEPDGSWATNGSGIFWFDERGVYHEWNGTYLVADAPFTLTQPTLLTISGTATATNPASK